MRTSQEWAEEICSRPTGLIPLRPDKALALPLIQASAKPFQLVQFTNYWQEASSGSLQGDGSLAPLHFYSNV